jgi:large subunit ribosomal protein L6
MSRIGKKPVSIPAGVTVKSGESKLMVKGPKGDLEKPLHDAVEVVVEESEVVVNPVAQTKLSRALWGTYASHVANMIQGVTEGFTKKLIIEGVGYRAETSGNKLVMQLGYSHPIEMEIPQDLDVSVEKNTITVSGIDKETVGQFAANIRSKRQPEPYKGKGVRYEDEIVRRKEGKKSA